MPDPNQPAFRIMSPFEIYLRTGLRVKSIVEVEQIFLKFNPWHDPRDGRFTFSGAGTTSGAAHQRSSSGASHSRQAPKQKPSHTHDAFRGGGGSTGGGGASGSRKTPNASPPFRAGGGSFGGHGATGSWSEPKQPSITSPKEAARQAALAAAAAASTKLHAKKPTVQSAPKPTNVPVVHHTIERNGYQFDIDHEGRTIAASGKLQLVDSPQRSRRAQSGAGGTDRKPADDGGHYIAARFRGPAEKFNHFAQDRNFNRGAYRALESQWAKKIAQGHKIMVTITPHYVGHSQRPDKLDVRWSIDGASRGQAFQNRQGGK
jgi:hypothetical protein